MILTTLSSLATAKTEPLGPATAAVVRMWLKVLRRVTDSAAEFGSGAIKTEAVIRVASILSLTPIVCGRL